MSRKSIAVSAITLIVILLLAMIDRPSIAGEELKSRVRVGIYDSRAIAIAYSSSSYNEAQMQTWRKKMEQAKKENDQYEISRIERAMDRKQWLAHRQAFGTASVDDAIDSVRDHLPSLAKELNVVLITTNNDFVDTDVVETVDVTDRVAALFKPQDRARKSIEAIRKIKPMKIDFDFQE